MAQLFCIVSSLTFNSSARVELFSVDFLLYAVLRSSFNHSFLRIGMRFFVELEKKNCHIVIFYTVCFCVSKVFF